MANYDKKLFDSDLDAFKNSGVILSSSLTFSGTLGGNGIQTQVSTPVIIPEPDLVKILFDNSIQHSGRFKDLALESGLTSVHESTTPTDLTAVLNIQVVGNQIMVVGTIFSPYSTPVSLQTTTINFRFLPFEATF